MASERQDKDGSARRIAPAIADRNSRASDRNSPLGACRARGSEDMAKAMVHTYTARVTWTQNKEQGTPAYDAYARDYDVTCAGRPILRGSADLRYLGDASRHNPEDLLVAALSACHMLWYLHLAAVSGVVVIAYEDNAEGRMQTHADGSDEFTEVTLRPRVTISAQSDSKVEMRLNQNAHGMCFIARSVNFPVRHEPETKLGNGRVRASSQRYSSVTLDMDLDRATSRQPRLRKESLTVEPLSTCGGEHSWRPGTNSTPTCER